MEFSTDGAKAPVPLAMLRAYASEHEPIVAVEATTGVGSDELWSDAYRVACIGASNPTAVATSLAKHTGAMVRELGTREACKHPALRAIAGHLAYLYGYGLGPDNEVLDEVIKNGQRLGICDARGVYTG